MKFGLFVGLELSLQLRHTQTRHCPWCGIGNNVGSMASFYFPTQYHVCWACKKKLFARPQPHQRQTTELATLADSVNMHLQHLWDTPTDIEKGE